MKYKSSITRGIKISILLLLLFWLINVFAIVNSSSLTDAIVFSVLMACFVIAFVSVLVKGIYVVLDNNILEYVHMFIFRKRVEVTKLTGVKNGTIAGMYKSLLLIYEDNGRMSDVKVSLLTFKKDTLSQLLLDLKKLNPQISIDPAIDKTTF